MNHKILVLSEFSDLSTGYAVYCNQLLHALSKKYEVAELARFIGPDDPRIYNKPWRVYPVLPPKNNEDLQAKFKADQQNIFGKSVFDEVCLEYKPTIVCLKPDTIITTINGHIPIPQVKVGDLVLTHNGHYKKVTKTFKHQVNESILSITINGNFRKLNITKEHPVLCFKKQKQAPGKKGVTDMFKNCEPIFIPAKNLRVGDTLCFPKEKIDNQYHEIDISKYLDNFVEKDNKLYCFSKAKNSHRGIKKYIKLDFNFGKLLGYIISDGSISDHGLSVTFHQDESRFTKDLTKICYEIFDFKPKNKKCVDKKSVITQINSTLLSEFLTKLIQRIHKNIPSFVKNNEDIIRGILTGIIRGDGSYKKNTINIITVREKLAYDYRQLCFILGIKTTITQRKQTTSFGTSIIYNVEAHGENAKKLHDFVHKFPTLDTPNKGIRDTSRIKELDKYYIFSIKDIHYRKYNGQVYNLEVEDDNSYIANQVCVHNCTVGDYWQENWLDLSAFRDKFHWIWLVTADAPQQHEEWLDVYSRVDSVLTYNDWSKETLEQESNGRIKVISEAPPAVPKDLKTLNSKAIKQTFGLHDKYVVGTVMRNQKRKEFPGLFKSFREFLSKTGRTDILLYCHTSYPDAGWDIPKLINKYGLSSKTLFTYRCQKCSYFFPAFFSDIVTTCLKCKQPAASMCSVKNGITSEELSVVYNLFDLFILYSRLEGFGMPAVEAAACGVPVIETDFSAMKDVVRKLGGTPIDVESTYTEIETGRAWAVPSNSHLVSELESFFNKPEQLIQAEGSKALANQSANYNWNKTIKVWLDTINSVDLKTYQDKWIGKPNLIDTNIQMPEKCSHRTFVQKLIKQLLPQLSGSYLELKLVRQLNYGVSVPNPFSSFGDDTSILGRTNVQPFTREDCINFVMNIVNKYNYWENIRRQSV